MTRRDSTHDDPWGEPQIEAMLDALGQADRAGAPAGLEDRVFTASLASAMGVVETSARMSELGAIDRASAGPGLEDRVQDTSAPVLAGRVDDVAVSHGPARRIADAAHRRRVRLACARRVTAVAAGVLVAVGVYTSMVKPSTSTPSGPPTGVVSAQTLEAQVDTKLDTLLLAMQDSTSYGGDSSDSDFSTEWLDDLSSLGGSGAARNGS